MKKEVPIWVKDAGLEGIYRNPEHSGWWRAVLIGIFVVYGLFTGGLVGMFGGIIAAWIWIVILTFLYRVYKPNKEEKKEKK